jgi:hypothetical protein
MQAKLLALGLEAALGAFAWYLTRPEHEQQALELAFWRAMEQWSMRVAKAASNTAAYASERYRETVSVA